MKNCNILWQVQDARDLIRIKAEAAAAAERCCSDLKFELESNRASQAAAEAAAAAAAAAAVEEAHAELDGVKQQLQVRAAAFFNAAFSLHFLMPLSCCIC